MDELLSELGIQFEELNLDDEFEAETLSYFITSHLERYPQVGEEILLPIHTLEEGEEKSLSIKVLWVKKSIVGEIAVEIK
jgi:transporter associated domain